MANERSLGAITPAGSGPVRATINEADPTAPFWCHGYRLQHWNPLNAGQGYAGTADMQVGTGSGVTGILPAIVPTAPFPVLLSIPVEGQSMVYNMAEVYIDADNATDSFLVSCTQA